MGLEFWLIPALVALVLGVWVFCMIMKYRGGKGVRTDGRTFVDKPVEEDKAFKSD